MVQNWALETQYKWLGDLTRTCQYGQDLRTRVPELTRWGHASPLADPPTQALCQKGLAKIVGAGKESEVGNWGWWDAGGLRLRGSGRGAEQIERRIRETKMTFQSEISNTVFTLVPLSFGR